MAVIPHTKFLTGLGYRRPCFKINKTLWLLNFMFFSSKAINKTWFWGVGPLLFCTIFLDLFTLYLKHILSCVYSVLACVFVCWHMWESVCMHMYMSMCVRVCGTQRLSLGVFFHWTHSLPVWLFWLASLHHRFHLCPSSVRITCLTVISTSHLHGWSGFELWFSCLHGKCFTHWAISLVHLLYLYLL